MVFGFAAPIFFAALRRPLTPSGARLQRTAAFIGLAVAWACCWQFSASAATDLIDLRPVTPLGSYRQVKAVVEVEGNLKLNADGKQVQHLPLKVQAEMQYAERVLAQAKQWADFRLARAYNAAHANIRLRESDLKNQLRDG